MASDQWSPKQYEKFKIERSLPFFDLIQLLQPSADPVVVDLGCGTGELTSELHRHCKSKSTLGIDSSDHMLNKAQQFATDRITFQKADIEKWNPNQRFDVIFSNAALQWCSDHPQILRNLRDSLAAKGQIAIQMPMNHDYPTHLLAKEMSYEEPWASLLKGQSYDQDNVILTPEHYASILFKLGFHEQMVLQRVYGHQLDNRQCVVEWVKGTLLTYFQSRLSESDFSRFLSEFKNRLFNKLPDDKPFFYPFKRIFLWGRLA